MSKSSHADRDLTFKPCTKMPPYYHDHGTHSSCTAGGELIYMAPSEHEKAEIGAIIKQFVIL